MTRPAPEQPKKAQTFYITKDIIKILRQIAKNEGRTLSMQVEYYLRKAVEQK